MAALMTTSCHESLSCLCTEKVPFTTGRAQLNIGLRSLINFQFVYQITAFFNPLAVFHAYAVRT